MTGNSVMIYFLYGTLQIKLKIVISKYNNVPLFKVSFFKFFKINLSLVLFSYH